MATEIIELVFPLLFHRNEIIFCRRRRFSNCSIHNYIFAREMMSKAIHFNLLFTEKFLFPFCCRRLREKNRKNLWLHKFVFNCPHDIIQFIHLFSFFLYLHNAIFHEYFSQPLIQMIDNFFASVLPLILSMYRNVLFQSSSSLFIQLFCSLLPCLRSEKSKKLPKTTLDFYCEMKICLKQWTRWDALLKVSN